MKHPAQVLALCGRNKELKDRLEEFASVPSSVIIKPVAFTDQIDEYMTASDLLLGKPGGLTTSEALAKGLVFVVSNPIPGQEERNSDHLLEEGVAIRCNNLPVLAYKIDKLLDDQQRFATMFENARAMGRPNAANTVVEKLLESAATAMINLSGEHHCESPLQMLVKPTQRPRRMIARARRNVSATSRGIARRLFKTNAGN